MQLAFLLYTTPSPRGDQAHFRGGLLTFGGAYPIIPPYEAREWAAELQKLWSIKEYQEGEALC